MWRMIVVLIVGIAAQPAYSQPRTLPQAPTPIPPIRTVAERAEFYQRIARVESTATLEQLALEAAAAAPGTAQRAEIELIVDRYFELDPLGAVRFAGELSRAGAPNFLAPLYERLARDDANAALAALSQVDDPVEAGIGALATLRGLGGDERAFELVAASLHGSAAEQFRADALAQLAATSPRMALTQALALSNPERRTTFATMVVSRWANDAPSDAMAAVERVQDPALKSMLRDIVLRSWRDPDGLAAYLATLDAESQRAALLSGALNGFVQADPRRAAEIAEQLPPGEERRRLLWQIATSFAQRDPDAALAWAQGFDAADPQLIVTILRNVAFKDPLRAFDLAESVAEPARSQTYFSAIGGPIADERQFSALANRVLAMQDGQNKTALVVALIGSWASRPGNTAPALDWMLANGAVLPVEAFERIGFQYAQANPGAAAAYIDRVPNGARAAWISAVTVGYATSDPRSASAFLERFRGDPAFDRAAVALSQQLAASDPPAAARLLASVGTRGADGAGPEIAIAGQWAQRDPAAAAAWALELPLLSRNIAMSIVTGTWALQDPDAVREWALRLPAGEKRDTALMAAVRSRGAAPPDSALLTAFSDDRARQSAMMNTILATAQTDAAAARRLIDGYITDPRLRAQAEQMIDGFARGAMPLPTGGFGVATGVIDGPPPSLAFGSMPAGAVFAPNGQPMTVVGPNGQPIMVRPPQPGLVPLPPSAIPAQQQVPVQRDVAR